MSRHADGKTGRATSVHRDADGHEQRRRQRRSSGSQPVLPRRPRRRPADARPRRHADRAAVRRPRLSPAPATPCPAASSPATAARPRSCAARPGSEWYASVEEAHDRLQASTATSSLPAACRWAASWPLQLAQNRPEDVHGLLLYAPTLKLDGWSMPWYSLFLQYLRPLPLRLRVRSRRARALRPQGRARARPGRLEHAERRRRPGRRVQHAAALVRQFQRAGCGGEAAISARCASPRSSCIRATTTWRA